MDSWLIFQHQSLAMNQADPAGDGERADEVRSSW